MRIRPYFIDFGRKKFQKGTWNFSFGIIFHDFFLEVWSRDTLEGGAKCSWGGGRATTPPSQTGPNGVPAHDVDINFTLEFRVM